MKKHTITRSIITMATSFMVALTIIACGTVDGSKPTEEAPVSDSTHASQTAQNTKEVESRIIAPNETRHETTETTGMTEVAETTEDKHSQQILFEVETTEHIHEWTTVYHDAITHQEPIYRTIHHDAVYEETWEVDQEAWIEDSIYEVHDICNCGFDFTAAGFTQDDINDHCIAHLKAHEADNWGNQYVLIKPLVYHEEVGHMENWLLDEAWDETIIDGYYTVTDQEAWSETYCVICGAEQ